MDPDIIEDTLKQLSAQSLSGSLLREIIPSTMGTYVFFGIIFCF
jgi:hypothetical protein